MENIITRTMGKRSSDIVWRILIGVFALSTLLLIFAGNELKEINLHKVTFFLSAFLALPILLYLITKVRKGKE